MKHTCPPMSPLSLQSTILETDSHTQENHIEGTELYYRLSQYHSVYLAHTEVDAPRIRRKYCGRQLSEVGQIPHKVTVRPTVASQFSSWRRHRRFAQ